MAAIPYVYLDIGLTDQFDDAFDTLGVQATNGSSNFGVFYIGTPTTGNQLQDATSPGGADIIVSIADSTPGTDVVAGDIKLATTQSGLATATGGDSIAVGTTIFFGAPAAIYYQWDNSVGGGDYTDISLDITAMVEATT